MRFDFAVYEQRVSTEHRLWNMLLPMHGLTCQYGATRSSAICDFHTTPIFIAMQILTRGYATTSFHASLPPAVPNSRLLPVLQVSYPPTHTLCHARYSCLYQRGSACWILGTYYDDDVLVKLFFCIRSVTNGYGRVSSTSGDRDVEGGGLALRGGPAPPTPRLVNYGLHVCA